MQQTLAPTREKHAMTGNSPRYNRWGYLLAIAAVLLLTYLLRNVLLPFVFAAALTYISRPAHYYLEGRLRLPRWASALIIYFAVLAVLALLVLWINSVLLPQTMDLLRRAPEISHALLVQMFGAEQFTIMGQQLTATQLSENLLGRAAAWMEQSVIDAVLTSLELIIGTVLTLVLLLYFLLHGERILRGSLWLVPPDLRPTAYALALEIDPILRRYIIGVLIVVIYSIALTWLMLGPLFGIRDAVLLAVVTGLLELIPVVGPVLSILMFVVIALQQLDLKTLVMFSIFLIVLRISIDQVVGPLVFGRAVKLHPVAVIFALLAGGVLYGVLGVLLAVPVTAVVKLVLERIYGDESSSTS